MISFEVLDIHVDAFIFYTNTSNFAEIKNNSRKSEKSKNTELFDSMTHRVLGESEMGGGVLNVECGVCVTNSG